jgi:hypothetical protein
VSHAASDRNLLFGVLALQMDFVSRAALVAAMNAWVLDKGKPLGQLLVEQGALGADNRAWLEAGVERHLANPRTRRPSPLDGWQVDLRERRRLGPEELTSRPGASMNRLPSPSPPANRSLLSLVVAALGFSGCSRSRG